MFSETLYVVDRILDLPVPARVAVAEIRLAGEPAVGDVHEIARDGDAEIHPFDFVAPLILVRPPDAGALALARRGDPGPPGRIRRERHPAEASLLARHARVVELDRIRAPGPQRLGKVHPDRVEFAIVFQRRRAEEDLLDGEVGVEVELDPRVVLEHLEANRVHAADRLLFRIDPDVEVVGEEVVVRAVAPVLAAQDVRARRRPLGGRLGRGRLRIGDRRRGGLRQQRGAEREDEEELVYRVSEHDAPQEHRSAGPCRDTRSALISSRGPNHSVRDRGDKGRRPGEDR